MAYILIADGSPTYPYSVDQLRADNPDTSFSAVIPDERLADWGVFPVAQIAAPEVEAGETAEEGAPALVDGVWTMSWIVRDRTPEELVAAKAAKLAAVKAQRDMAIDAGVDVAGVGRFDSDPLSRANINGAVTGAMLAQGAGQPFAVNWKMQDNSIIALDGAGMIAVGLVVLGHVTACHENAQAIGLAIDAAEDFDTLEAIDLADGWP